MKKIEAVFRLSKFDAVRDALAEIGVTFFTMKDVKGFGLQQEKRVYRGSVYDAAVSYTHLTLPTIYSV